MAGAKLDSCTARCRLAAGKWHWRTIADGIAVGYRRGPRGGAWRVRLRQGYDEYRHATLGKSDDTEDSDGTRVLSFEDAQREALRRAAERGVKHTKGTVAGAVAAYLEDYEARGGKAVHETTRVCTTYVLPALGKRKLSELTTSELKAWRNGLARAKPRARPGRNHINYRATAPDTRARRSTANRLWTVLRAVLNYAYQDGLVGSDDAWQRIRPYQGVDAPVVRYLTEDEARRLVNACEPDFRLLVQGALYAGCRYGELVALKVGDYNPDSGTMLVRDPKSGRPRHVPLTTAGQQFLARVCVGRPNTETLFIRSDGEPWRSHQQKRRIDAASTAASIGPPATFHQLRHTYAATLAMRGVQLQVIAGALGHADTRVTERNYAHLSPGYVADTVRANLPDLGGFEPDQVASL